MAKRPVFPLIISLTGLAITLLLLKVFFSQDFSSPILFLIKAGFMQLATVILISTAITSLIFKTKSVYFSFIITYLCLAPPILEQIAWNRPIRITPKDQPLTIASFSAMTRTRNGEDIKQWLQEAAPKIVCLQEITSAEIAILQTEYTANSASQPKGGLLTLSQFPLKILHSSSLLQTSVVTHPKWGNIKIINVHMPRQYKSIEQTQQNWNDITHQIDKAQRMPIILCGDFNMTPYNSYYQFVTGSLGFSDAHIAAGTGFGFTFPNKNRRLSMLGPQLRIDYLLTKGFETKAASSVNISNESDHKAITAKLMKATL